MSQSEKNWNFLVVSFKKRHHQNEPLILSSIFKEIKKNHNYEEGKIFLNNLQKKKMSPSKSAERLEWRLRAAENKGCCMTTNDGQPPRPLPLPLPLLPALLSPVSSRSELLGALILHSAQLKEASTSKPAKPRLHPYWPFITATLKAVSSFNSVLVTTREFNAAVK